MAAVAFRPDGKRAVTVSNDHSLRIWNLAVRYHQREDAKLLVDVPLEVRRASPAAPPAAKQTASPERTCCGTCSISHLQGRSQGTLGYSQSCNEKLPPGRSRLIAMLYCVAGRLHLWSKQSAM